MNNNVIPRYGNPFAYLINSVCRLLKYYIIYLCVLYPHILFPLFLPSYYYIKYNQILHPYKSLNVFVRCLIFIEYYRTIYVTSTCTYGAAYFSYKYSDSISMVNPSLTILIKITQRKTIFKLYHPRPSFLL